MQALQKITNLAECLAHEIPAGQFPKLVAIVVNKTRVTTGHCQVQGQSYADSKNWSVQSTHHATPPFRVELILPSPRQRSVAQLLDAPKFAVCDCPSDGREMDADIETHRRNTETIS